MCYPIPITSGNSYFPTTNYFFIKKSDLTNNQELIPISLFRLKTQVIKVYNYSDSFLYIAVESITVRPTCRLTRTEIWNAMNEHLKQT